MAAKRRKRRKIGGCTEMIDWVCPTKRFWGREATANRDVMGQPAFFAPFVRFRGQILRRQAGPVFPTVTMPQEKPLTPTLSPSEGAREIANDFDGFTLMARRTTAIGGCGNSGAPSWSRSGRKNARCRWCFPSRPNPSSWSGLNCRWLRLGWFFPPRLPCIV